MPGFARKPNRKPQHDYHAFGRYFITCNSVNREKLFWLNGDLDYAERNEPPELSELGKMVESVITELSQFYTVLDVDKFSIMPDHVHMLLVLHPTDDDPERSSVSVPTIIKQFKWGVVNRYGKNVWQKGHYDHVIRSDEDYGRVWNDIDNNPYRLDKMLDGNDAYYTLSQ